MWGQDGLYISNDAISDFSQGNYKSGFLDLIGVKRLIAIIITIIVIIGLIAFFAIFRKKENFSVRKNKLQFRKRKIHV
jgi:flagellar biosynthesis/type III secretory pathway M-ring protein FliF/YscJ